MAKGKNNPTGENDYIDQLNWNANHHRHVPVRFIPNWKYKITFRSHPISLFGRVIRATALIGLIGLIVYLISNSTMVLGVKIFYSVIFGLIITIIFFAISETSNDSNDSNERLD